MSSRVTRSSARRAANQAASAQAAPNLANLNAPASSTTQPQPQEPPAPANLSTATLPFSKKRKTSSRESAVSNPSNESSPVSAPRRSSKRQKGNSGVSPSGQPSGAQSLPQAAPRAQVQASNQAQTATGSSSNPSRRRKGKTAPTMASQEKPPAAGPSNPTDAPSSASSSRKSSRNRKTAQNTSGTSPPSHIASQLHSLSLLSPEQAGPSSSTRKSKRTANNPPPPPPPDLDEDTPMTGTDDNSPSEKAPAPPPLPPPPHHHDDDDSDDGYNEDEHEDHHIDDDDDPFGGFGGGHHGHSLSSTLRALTGMMSGISSRLRGILENLRKQEDPSMQLIALQELSEILLVSNEDNLSGHFQPDMFVKELVVLMRPHPITMEENPEMMLLACRCLANLMEALPSSVSSVVYGGAVPVLCEKLIEINYIDIAEQAVSTLEKISFEFPAAIVREGGLVACLSYLDFFPTSTQRTAVTTAANCCRNIPEDSFDVVKSVMPILLNVLNSIDQRVVEQASICVSRIVESFKYAPSRLEELVSIDLLNAILRLLVPGTTNLIGPSIHTQFLRVLVFTAKASPRLSAEMFKMNVVETLYQILTGVSPPSGSEDVASKLESVVIMQALIHRPRDQIMETLNVICELLPSLPGNADPASGDFIELSTSSNEPITPASTAPKRKSSNDKRLELIGECKQEVRRFALILFPTLTDAFSSTVNLNVRQKVLTAQLKMLSNLDVGILHDALKTVPYASFMASILSQQDHPSLVMLALQAGELLLSRLDDIYRYQLYREGVFSEITKLASEDHSDLLKAMATSSSSESPTPPPAPTAVPQQPQPQQSSIEASASDSEEDERSPDTSDEEPEEDDDNDEDNDNDDPQDEMSGSPVSSGGSTMSIDGPPRHYITDAGALRARITEVAKQFLETHETEKHSKTLKKKAAQILENLQKLASEIEAFYLHRTATSLAPQAGIDLFKRLAAFFEADVLESVTSAELLASSLVRVLEEVFSNPDEVLANTARMAFVQVFMAGSSKTRGPDSPTAFGILVHKLQDLLSRSEHFEVITVHQNTFDGNRSSAASMLAKQIRLKLSADEDSDIPKQFRSVMVSIHAIATFKALDDYLRPRISLTERPRGSRHRDSGLQRTLAAMASIAGTGMPPIPPSLRGNAPIPHPRSSMATPPPPPPPPPPPQPSSSRSSRKSKSKSSAAGPSSNAPQTPEPGSGSREQPVLRRSSRRNATAAEATPTIAPPRGDEDMQNTLECADEKQLSDSDSNSASGSGLDAVVGGLDEDMEDAPTPEPGAVNMEVAAGGRITARKDDGTRVPTPSQSLAGGGIPPPPRAPVAASSHGTPMPSIGSSLSARSMSYAAAMQLIPSDWHIEFSLNGKVIANETTIYRAVHNIDTPVDEHFSRNVWSAVHTIKFRRVPGPPPPESISFSSASDNGDSPNSNTPASLTRHPTTASILRLLRILHELNANVDDVVLENRDALSVQVEPLSQFVNTKLTAKLNRQLEEPLIVASNCLPPWSEDLARLYPFLFPFETRHLFLQSTSFGYARSMTRWQNSQANEDNRRDRRDERPFLGRLQRQKVRISRSKILESAIKVMELYGASQSILEVEYFEEVGTGLGPTLEFYSTVSKEFSKKKLKLWREMDSNESTDFVSAQTGLFPRPLGDDESSNANSERILQLYRVLGKFVARSMLDSRIIDINFNPIFFRIGEGTTGIKPSLGAIKSVDPVLARSLKAIKKFAIAKKEIDEDPLRTPAQKVADTEKIMIEGSSLEDLSLDFTLPGYPNIDLVPNGSHVLLTIDNVDQYLENVVDATLGSGVRRQVDSFRAGFSQVFPYSALSAFTPDELVILFGRVDEDWSLETLMDSIKADHGYNMDSKSVKNLLQVMSELTAPQRRDFLQFTTGSPKLPIGGFKSLTPMFTVVCKPSEPPFASDDYLPSVMTCVNYLKLPDYANLDSMRKQLFVAIKEGQGAFHLS
ncbi:HECT-domain-containing protein [Zalerion maritima]|uniref:HECT-type E3 ubiquitin transferase n=1 Tax=Zalerion maritima TaxID=339359 RepID=A0AAD5WVM9_9PEZI|nr:HECT-domain-containing protein [Zalerion maritima]